MKIHHYCKCLDRKFSFEEWSEYLKENNSSDSVFSFKGFDYNIHDVCINPKIEFEYKDDENEIQLYYSQCAEGVFSFGYHYYSLRCGGCRPSLFTLDCKYINSDQAIKAGLKELLSHKSVQNSKKFKEILQEKLFSMRQLNLFK